MQPNEPTDPIAITLQVQEWNWLLGVLNDTPLPHRLVDPLIRKIIEQARANTPDAPLVVKPNGADDHAPH